MIESCFQRNFLHVEPLRHWINMNPQFGWDHIICCDSTVRGKSTSAHLKSAKWPKQLFTLATSDSPYINSSLLPSFHTQPLVHVANAAWPREPYWSVHQFKLTLNMQLIWFAEFFNQSPLSLILLVCVCIFSGGFYVSRLIKIKIMFSSAIHAIWKLISFDSLSFVGAWGIESSYSFLLISVYVLPACEHFASVSDAQLQSTLSNPTVKASCEQRNHPSFRLASV